uniref:Trefoil factor 1 n=1 Tax=Propithecus coquereli TaxID=379532 RepID=A0A2K6GPR1_PROCO
EATMEHKAICALVVVFLLALSTRAKDAAETCSMEPRERVNCGFPGVTSSECESKGCCFDDAIAGYPWCFNPKTRESTQEEECEF